MIASLFFLSVVASVVVGFLLPKQYKAEAVLLPIEESGMGGLASVLSSSPLGSLVGGGALGGGGSQKLRAVLNSRSVKERVIERLDLMKVFYREAWDSQNQRWRDPEDPPLLEDAVQTLSGMTGIEEDTKDGTLAVNVVYEDPVLSKEMVDAYIAELADFLNTHSLNVNFQILDPAKVPERKFKPKRLLIVTLGALCSLFFGILLAFFLESVRKMREE